MEASLRRVFVSSQQCLDSSQGSGVALVEKYESEQPSNWTNFNKTQTLAMQRLMAYVTNTADGGRGNVLCVCVCSTAS